MRQMDSTESTQPKSGGNFRLYGMAAIGCFILAFALYALSRPIEKTGPPQGAVDPSDPASAPHAHNQEEFDRQLNALRAQEEQGAVSEKERLLLANLLYDRAARTLVSSDTEDARRDGVALFREASTHYKGYLDLVPDNPDARTDYAYTLYQQGRINQAIHQLSSVRASFPEHQNSAFNLAIMYKEKDQPDSVLYFMHLTAEIDSTSRTGLEALRVLRAYNDAH